MPEELSESEINNVEEKSATGFLSLINFLWQKFSNRNEVLEEKEKILEKEFYDLEAEMKLKKMRSAIDKIDNLS
jgi:hypothetical protein